MLLHRVKRGKERRKTNKGIKRGELKKKRKKGEIGEEGDG